jgi:hypothetical protein
VETRAQTPPERFPVFEPSVAVEYALSAVSGHPVYRAIYTIRMPYPQSREHIQDPYGAPYGFRHGCRELLEAKPHPDALSTPQRGKDLKCLKEEFQMLQAFFGSFWITNEQGTC